MRSGRSWDQVKHAFQEPCYTLPPMIQFRRIVSPVTVIENIAISGGIKDLARLRRTYGGRRWRKGKGWAFVELKTGGDPFARLALCEAHGTGKKIIKMKSPLGLGNNPFALFFAKQ